MKRLALAAALVMLVAVACVAFGADAPEPTLYVQVAFYSCITGDADAEALAAWNSFVAEANKLAPCVGEWHPRKAYPDGSLDPNRTSSAALDQPRLTSTQIAALSLEIGKLLDSPCFRHPQFSMKLSRTPIQIKPYVDPQTIGDKFRSTPDSKRRTPKPQ